MSDTNIINNDSIAIIHYTLTDADGTLLYSSFKGEPEIIALNNENVPLGIRNNLMDKSHDDKLEFDIEAKEAFGEYDNRLVFEIDLSDLNDAEGLEVGDALESQNDDGQTLFATLVEKTADKAYIDGNHPLAGEAISVKMDIMEVTDINMISDEQSKAMNETLLNNPYH